MRMRQQTAGLPMLALLLAAAVPSASAYWREECGGEPPEFFLGEEGKPLDCALRELGLKYAAKVLASHKHLAMILPRVHYAFNLSACGVEVPRGVAATAAAAGNGRPGDDAAGSPEARAAAAVAALGATAELHVAPAPGGSDSSGDGSARRPFATVGRAQAAARAAATAGGIVWLRQGVHYQPSGPLTLTVKDAGTTYAGWPGENVTLSGAAGALPASLPWVPVGLAEQRTLGLRAAAGAGAGVAVYKTKLPPALLATEFVGLFADGKRLPRARYPNCDDITGVNCYTLNASGPTSNPNTPLQHLDQGIAGDVGYNLNVKNQHGVDMFADKFDNALATGPHAASDATLPMGKNLTVTVDHPDFAWRCHEDCGWSAYSHWRSGRCTPYPPKAALREGGGGGLAAAAPLRAYGGPPATACRHDTTYNEPYWDQQVSGGFFYNATSGPYPWAPGWTTQKWAEPSTGVVHMYHSARWGGWQYKLAARNDTDHSLQFACAVLDGPDEEGFYSPGKGPAIPCPKQGAPGSQAKLLVHGGWQEARGAAISPQYTAPTLNNSYFIENIKEELDAEGEWFLDLKEGTLYLIPPAGKKPAALLLEPVHQPTVFTVLGSAAAPVTNVGLVNVTIAHAAPTFLEPYEMSSGGDWAIHRGAAVFIDGAKNVTVQGCLFDQTDGNGIFFSRYVRNSTIKGNAFVEIGDSAVLVVGASGRHRTNQATNLDYPAFNTIEANYAGNVGVWSKQSAAYYKSVTRENKLVNNVFHDGPRSGVNYNDGAMGGELMQGNLLLNFVKESNDHGPFNSWDRQPYVFRADEDDLSGTGKLLISPLTQTIANNLIFNVNFHGQSCGSIALDHDDESSQYNDTENVLVFGGIKFFDGINRHASKNLIVYPYAAKSAGAPCFHALNAQRNLSSHFSHFFENDCVMRATDFPYNCGAGPAPFYNKTDRVDVHSNTFYRLNPTAGQDVTDWSQACGCWPNPKLAGPCPIKNFSDWQARGLDIGSTIKTELPDAALLAMAKAKLGMK